MATTNPIDEYLAALGEPKRTTLTSSRDTIMVIVPDAEQCISYGPPADNPHQSAPGLRHCERNSPARPSRRWPFSRSGRTTHRNHSSAATSS
jgi:hypothetical protein